MVENNNNQPATKGDLAAVRSELAEVKTELKSDLAAVKSELKNDIADVRSELTAVKGDLNNKFKSLSGEILKFHFKMDRMENRLNTEFSTKADINRVYNLLDAIAGDIKSYQRKDAQKLSNHETRITLLETKK
ncbi:MAG: hypothetical protein HY796_05795 [Elusimicrobia bacterium]|nr:hypothetical protein [Elusimicrobiota bacterium]